MLIVQPRYTPQLHPDPACGERIRNRPLLIAIARIFCDARLYRPAPTHPLQRQRNPISPIRIVGRAGPVDSRAPSKQILDWNDHQLRWRRIQQLEDRVARRLLEHPARIHLAFEAERAHEFLAVANRLRVPPYGQRLSVMRPRSRHREFGIVLRIYKWLVTVAPVALPLHHLVSRHAQPRERFAHPRRHGAQVFRHQFRRARLLLDYADHLFALAALFVFVHRREISRRIRIRTEIERPKKPNHVIDSDQIVKRAGMTRPRAQHFESLRAHLIPVRQRQAPSLSLGIKAVGGSTDSARQIELALVRPHLGAVAARREREVSADERAVRRRIYTHIRPLPMRNELPVDVHPDRIGQLASRGARVPQHPASRFPPATFPNRSS